jgi:hypothetical protein
MCVSLPKQYDAVNILNLKPYEAGDIQLSSFRRIFVCITCPLANFLSNYHSQWERNDL